MSTLDGVPKEENLKVPKEEMEEEPFEEKYDPTTKKFRLDHQDTCNNYSAHTSSATTTLDYRIPKNEVPLMVPKDEPEEMEETGYPQSQRGFSPVRRVTIKEYLAGTKAQRPKKQLTPEESTLLENIFLDNIAERGIFFDTDSVIKSLVKKTCLTKVELREWFRQRKEKVRQEVPACLSKATSEVFERVYAELKIANPNAPFLSPEALENLSLQVNEDKKKIRRWFNYKRYRDRQQGAIIKTLAYPYIPSTHKPAPREIAPKAPAPGRRPGTKNPPPCVSEEARMNLQKQIRILEELYQEYGQIIGPNGVELSVQDLQFLGNNCEMDRDELEEWFQGRIVEEQVSTHLVQFQKAQKDPSSMISRNHTTSTYLMTEFRKQNWTDPERTRMLSEQSRVPANVIERWFIDKRYEEGLQNALDVYRQCLETTYNQDYPFMARLSPKLRAYLIEIRYTPRKFPKDVTKLARDLNEPIDFNDVNFFYAKENRNERQFLKEFLDSQLEKITEDQRKVLTDTFHEWRINVNVYLKKVSHLELSTPVIREFHAILRRDLSSRHQPSTSSSHLLQPKQEKEELWNDVMREEPCNFQSNYEYQFEEEPVVGGRYTTDYSSEKPVKNEIVEEESKSESIGFNQKLTPASSASSPSQMLTADVKEENWVNATVRRFGRFQQNDPLDDLLEDDEDYKMNFDLWGSNIPSGSHSYR